MYTFFHLNLLIILYIYLLLISILCELIETRENKILKIFLVNHINTKSILLNRLNINLLSIILKKNNVDELLYYFDKEKKKIEYFLIGYT